MNRLLTVAILATLPAAANAEPVIVPTSGTVPETMERLRASVDAAGARVFGVVDFGGGIRRIGEDVGEVQLLIFGDPRIGAQALSADRMAALDLPGKVLVYDTATGSAMAYEQPTEMLAEWNIPADAPVLDLMSRTLNAITSAAARGYRNDKGPSAPDSKRRDGTVARRWAPKGAVGTRPEAERAVRSAR